MIESCWDIKLNRSESGHVELSITGANTKGTTVKLKAKMPDYFLTFLARYMYNYSKEKVVNAIKFKDEIKNTFSE